MISIRQQIEDGIIDAIGDQLLKSKNPRAGYLKAVEPYNGQIDQVDGINDFITAYRGRSPFVLVAPGGAQFDGQSISKTRFERTITIDLYFGSNHMRTRASRHRKDIVATDKDETADPGIYTTIEDVQSILSGSDLGINGVGPLTPSREDVLLQEKTLTVWRVSYETPTDAHVKPRDFGDQALTATLFQAEDADVDEDEFPGYNPVAEAEQDLT